MPGMRLGNRKSSMPEYAQVKTKMHFSVFE